MSKKTFTLIILIVLIGLGGAYYWFFVRTPSININTTSGINNTGGNGIFASSGGVAQTGKNTGTKSASSSNSNSASTTVPTIPVLRELSPMPVGGMVSSSTASTTIVRWVDRGTGHIYQAYSDNTAISEISNTTVPMIYESYWNMAANAFIFRSLADDTDVITNFYATLAAVNASTSSSTTPYSLAGSPLSSQTIAVAVSPAIGKTGNQVFTLVDDGNGGSTGFISNFDGSKKAEIFNTPLQQLNVAWPASNTIALTTKGSATQPGYLYFVNTKTGIFTKIIGSVNGLSTLVNADASEVLYSDTNSGGDGVTTSIYNVLTGQNQTLPFGTLAEKCVWSALQKTNLYCAIPLNVPEASYPDAWYQGTVSFSDSIWEVDTITGNVHELVDLAKTSGQTIDAENLQLSPSEDTLYFINKKDLSLWSFNLNAI